MDATTGHILIDGNTAAALGCVYAGATVAAWYPITPSTSLMDAFKEFCERYRKDPETGQEQLLHRAGRGRARGDRHGDRRGLERRARVHADGGPGHLADERVHRPRLLRRDPGGHRSTCSASGRRPACRRARSRATSCGCAYASHGDTKHILLFPRESRASASTLAVDGVRPRRAVPDAGLRAVGPRHRHERLDVPAARVGRQLPARPRQGADGRASSRAWRRFHRYRRRGRRRHRGAHAARRASEGRVSSCAARATTSSAATPRTRTSTRRSWTAWCASTGAAARGRARSR